MAIKQNEEAKRLARLTGNDYYVVLENGQSKVVSCERFRPPDRGQQHNKNIIFVAFAKTLKEIL